MSAPSYVLKSYFLVRLVKSLSLFSQFVPVSLYMLYFSFSLQLLPIVLRMLTKYGTRWNYTLFAAYTNGVYLEPTPISPWVSIWKNTKGQGKKSLSKFCIEGAFNGTAVQCERMSFCERREDAFHDMQSDSAFRPETDSTATASLEAYLWELWQFYCSYVEKKAAVF